MPVIVLIIWCHIFTWAFVYRIVMPRPYDNIRAIHIANLPTSWSSKWVCLYIPKKLFKYLLIIWNVISPIFVNLYPIRIIPSPIRFNNLSFFRGTYFLISSIFRWGLLFSIRWVWWMLFFFRTSLLFRFCISRPIITLIFISLFNRFRFLIFFLSLIATISPIWR